jgi:prophage regulatory protein
MGRLLTRTELDAIKGISYSRSQLWKLEQAGKFPRRVTLGIRTVRWDEEEIDAYINAKRAARLPVPPSPIIPSRFFRRVKRRA